MIGEMGIDQGVWRYIMIARVPSIWQIIMYIMKEQNTLTFVCTLLETWLTQRRSWWKE